MSVDGRSAAVYAGVNPGSRLRLSLTLPSSFRSRLVVTASYLRHELPYSQSSGSRLDDRGFAVKATFDLGPGAGPGAAPGRADDEAQTLLPRRSRRFLRLGRAERQPRPQRKAGHRRGTARPSRRRIHLLLRSSGVRSPIGHADIRGVSALPPRRICDAADRPLLRAIRPGHGGLLFVHARGPRESPSTRPSST